MSGTKSSSSSLSKKVIKRAGKSKHKLAGPKISTPKTPKAGSDALYKLMCEEHTCGITEWTKIELASSIGYANPRSDKCSKMFKVLIKEEQLAEKGATADVLVLTVKGIAQKPAECQPKDIAEVHNRMIAGLEKKIALGSTKVRPLWAILQDRQVHTMKDVSEMLGYKNQRSFDNTKIVATMKKMGLVTAANLKKGQIMMTDKPFPSLGQKQKESVIVDL